MDPDRVFYDPHTDPQPYFYNIDTGERTAIDAAEVGINGLPGRPRGRVGVDIIVRPRTA